MNSSGWARFRPQAETELAQLRHLLAVYAPLLEKCRQAAPDLIECSALATMLHSFYTGVENILKRAAVEIDGQPIEGASWHRQLLQRTGVATANRPAVISVTLLTRLQDYLGFRHFFRSAYSFDYDWNEMAPLVLDCEPTLQKFGEEIAAFLAQAPPENATD